MPTTTAVQSSVQPSSATFDLARSLSARRGLFATPERKLIAALLLSIAAHLAASVFVHLESPEAPFVPLTAKFMSLPPPAVPTPNVAPVPNVPAAPKVRKLKPKPATNESVVSTPQNEALPSDLPVLPAPSELPEPGASADPTPAPAPIIPEPAPIPVPATPPAAAAASTSASATELPERSLPKKIELGYTAFYGEQKFMVGPVKLTFTHKDGRYNLKIVGRGKGLAALLYPGTFTGESEGTITAQGLRPDKFIEERGNPDKRKETVFDHVAKVVRIPDKPPIAFEGAPLDPLTWIVQFYFAMPKGNKTTFTVASARSVDVYELERAGEEILEIPNKGAVKTQIWKGTRKKNEDGSGGGSAQFWLSAEDHFVPFKLQMVNAQGRMASFDLTAISTE